MAVENARLYDAARRQQRWIQASAEVTTRLLSGSEPGEVLAYVTRQALELSGADLAVLALPDEEGRRLTITYAEGDGAAPARGLVLPIGQSLSGLVLASGEPLTSADFAADERASQAARGAMSQIGPAVVFPLGAPGNVRGVLTVGRRHGAAPFPPPRPASRPRSPPRRASRSSSRPAGRTPNGCRGPRTGSGSAATCTTWLSSGCTPPACRWRAPCR